MLVYLNERLSINCRILVRRISAQAFMVTGNLYAFLSRRGGTEKELQLKTWAAHVMKCDLPVFFTRKEKLKVRNT